MTRNELLSEMKTTANSYSSSEDKYIREMCRFIIFCLSNTLITQHIKDALPEELEDKKS
jgi:hypothetical protein